jgi:membrane-associated protease RseP (regulator of RpoE activity)
MIPMPTAVVGTAAVVTAFLLVLIPHEAGHMLAGRLLGVRVEEFSLGFGPGVSVRRRGTTYSLRLIPIGAYVRMPDDYEDAVAPWRRLLISAAGPAASFGAAFVYLAVAATMADGSMLVGVQSAMWAAWSTMVWVVSNLGLVLDIHNISGPIGIGQAVAQTSIQGWEPWMVLLAAFSASIGLLNLLPIGPLDGGGMLTALIALVVGRRLRGLVTGYRIAGLVVLLGLIAYASWADLLRVVG